MKTLKNIFLILFFFIYRLEAQIDSLNTLSFDFNEHIIKENNNKIIPKAEGVTLTYDRFGNEKSAVYIHGHNSSYLNLGTSKSLKSPIVTISLWVNLERRVYNGTGYDYNPILTIKNGPGYDFINALVIVYDSYTNRLGVNSAKDSTMDVTVLSEQTYSFNKWNHLVLVCNNNFLAFYIDGVLQGKAKKNFETKFLESDSLIIGHSASIKNERFSQGIFDDIRFFHRSLSEQEIIDLYNEPNPNKIKNLLTEVLKYGIIIFVLIVIIILLFFQNKRKLKKEKEKLELSNKISELELKVVKAQMNPHFVSNSLAAIQELIYTNHIEKGVQYLAKFSYLLRQILNYSDENYISISEEIEIINLYIELEKLRFSDNFKFELIIDKNINTDEILIPSLITQPFIENAIWHGLLPVKKNQELKLIIRVYINNGFPFIEIEDNGVGRDLSTPNKKTSKGSKLILEKLDNLNRLNNTTNYKIDIIDLFSENLNQIGTKIIIQLDNIK